MDLANPFVTSDVARRYARARPNYHPQALAVALSMLGEPSELALGLDLGCGTGMSTLALSDLCGFVVGTDVSFEMVRHATAQTTVAYSVATAERLPTAAATFDIASAGAAFHWFEQDKALREIKRALRPGGFFIVYTDWFTGRLRGIPEFEKWMESYITSYPSPGRNAPFDEELAAHHGFEFLGTKTFEAEFEMEMDMFSEYLLSQSNAAAAIEQERTTAQELKRSIEADTRQWFPATAQYEGQVWCCQS